MHSNVIRICSPWESEYVIDTDDMARFTNLSILSVNAQSLTCQDINVISTTQKYFWFNNFFSLSFLHKC
jgi:hypothetical protein